MPRTKYIVVFSAILIGLLIVVGLFFAFRVSPIALYGNEHTALLIQSEVTTPTAEVENDTTREETRTSLRAALQGYVAQGATAAIPEEMETGDSAVDLVRDANTVGKEETDFEDATLLCDSAVSSIPPADTWGLVNTTLAEGARVVSSLELDAFGVPKYHLQIPMTPIVASLPQCLPQAGMVGIALDGQVIKTDAPFSTDAEGIAGYALDGFGIFSKYENGSVVTNADLDQCHGHVHMIVWNGILISLYHYHVTENSRYALGCFRGNPVQL